jgi:hypothetical protein
MDYYPDRSYYRYDLGYLTPIGKEGIPPSLNPAVPQNPYNFEEKE